MLNRQPLGEIVRSVSKTNVEGQQQVTACSRPPQAVSRTDGRALCCVTEGQATSRNCRNASRMISLVVVYSASARASTACLRSGSSRTGTSEEPARGGTAAIVGSDTFDLHIVSARSQSA